MANRDIVFDHTFLRIDDAETEPDEPIFGWKDLRELECYHISIQSHGVTHRSLSELTAEELRDEIVGSKAELEDGLGKPVEIFAYPSGDSGASRHDVGAVLERAGYRAACLYGGGPIGSPVADRYRLPRLAMGPDTDLAKLLSRFHAPVPARPFFNKRISL